MTRFSVDLVELDAAVGSLDAFAATLADALAEVAQTVGALQQEWLGQAADAHAVAHRRLAAGAQEVHAALVELQAAARHAHGSYAAAVAANTATWRQIGA